MPHALSPSSSGNWLAAPKPTRWTLFLRTFLPWQLWRFVSINVKMLRIIARGHSEMRRPAGSEHPRE